MLHLHLVFVGKTQFPDLEMAIARYLDRLAHYVSVKVHIVRAEKIASKIPEDAIRRKEAERILKLAGRQSYLVVWDEGGRQVESQEFAALLGWLMQEGPSDVWMVIGGPLGVASELKSQARMVLSLSRMTFPHDMARLMVVEQLYRAFSILKGESYHK